MLEIFGAIFAFQIIAFVGHGVCVFEHWAVTTTINVYKERRKQ